MIPLVDLTAQYHSIKSELDFAVQNVFETGHFILGPNVTALEVEIAAYLGVNHAIGVASGTDALVLALRACDIGPGDEVIIPAYTFFATAGAVLMVGATPVFVDVDPIAYGMDVQQAERVITSHTKAIIPVHLYGQPANMKEILAFAHKYELKVIEDNAQAFGAEIGGKKTGSLGDIGCLSFFPTKNLGGAGDGGMVVTSQPVLAEKIKMLRTHGWKKKYFPEMLGYNSRLDELQAAILRVKLKYLDQWNTRRREIAQIYRTTLDPMGYIVPQEIPGTLHVYHLFVVRHTRRENIRQALNEVGIASDVYYPQPPYLANPCLSLGHKPGDFPAADLASLQTFAIPLYPEISDQQIIQILDVLSKTHL